MLAAVAAHLVVAVVLPFLAPALGRRVYLVGAVLPAAVFGWLLAQAPSVVDGGRPTEAVSWAATLDLEIALRLSPLALLMALLVTGIGALVFLYAYAYHSHDHGGFGRGSSALLAFAGAMLGLVLSDDLLVLYVFWELTTVFSFVLIGQAGLRRDERRSASQALLITTLGGLAMLFGFVLLGETAGTYRISQLVAEPPPSSGVVTAALLLVLVGALTKSAQLPFHSWLPAAMVAPTPVSAYLHAAAMVKAGVFLIATLMPVFAGEPVWRWTAVVVGATTMLLGGWRAMAETDLKRLLAFGTISQLGFLTVLAGFGSRTAALAVATMIVAHALFKSTLFMVVGIVDHQAGTRDLRDLSGLWRALPWTFAAAVLASGSMAGVPPLLGFLGKEAAFEALLHGTAVDTALLVVLLVGSTLTVAYTVRFLVGAFATKPAQAGAPALAPTPVTPAPASFVGPALVPALAGLGLGLGYPVVDAVAGAYAAQYPSSSASGSYHLAVWHGLGVPLGLSALALAAGGLLAGKPLWLSRLRARTRSVGNAQRGYETSVSAVEWLAVRVTGRTQVGSLPVYLGVILITVLVVPGTALVTGTSWPSDLPAWDYPIQVPLAVGIGLCALAIVRARARLTAVLLLGAVGYGIGALFVVDGAPDLALAQLLVESLSLIVFVFVLRRMPVRFSTAGRESVLRWPRVLIAVAVGAFVTVFAVVTSGSRQDEGVATTEYLQRSPEQTGATNVVNGILVDFRAFDTFGEISVLAVAAVGVASMLLFTRAARAAGVDHLADRVGRRRDPGQAPNGTGRGRSILLEVTARAVFPVVLMFSLYLLFGGHTRTGGGFSGGLVAGLAFVLRYVAGERRQVGAAVPAVPPTVIGAGLVVAGMAAFAPVLVGDPPLSSYVFEADWPVLGHVELVTSLFFDLGVYILIIGVVLELLRTLGTAVDKEDAVTTPPPPSPTLESQAVESQAEESQAVEEGDSR